MKTFIGVVAVPVILAAIQAAAAAAANPSWPVGFSYIALVDGQWRAYVVTPGDVAPRRITTVMEPRHAAYSVSQAVIAYVAPDGSLREASLAGNEERVLMDADPKRAATQPTYTPKGDRLVVVILKDGASVDTDIVALNSQENRAIEPVITQRSAQFEPYITASGAIYYSNVLCTVECGKIIQEIWRRDLRSGVAEQVTLTNAIAREPAVSNDEKWLYFSSNRSGPYHIWRIPARGGIAERVTRGDGTDTNPAVDTAGNVYFIRRKPDRTQLIKKSPSGPEQALALPDAAEDVRNLEIVR